MIKKDLRKRNNPAFGILAFAALWYFYFASSFVLRPYPQLFWTGMAALSAFIWIGLNQSVSKADVYYFCGMFVLLMLALLSRSPKTSAMIVVNYLIYYLTARMVTRHSTSRVVIGIVVLFSLIHLVCLYIQVFAGGVYESTILPLLPAENRAKVLAQMKYNEAFYGFTVQTSVIAIYMSVGAVYFGTKVSCAETRRAKIINIVVLCLFMIGLFFTVRRGSVVVVTLLLVLMFLQSRGNVFNKTFIAVAVVGLLLFIGLENIPGLSGVFEKFERQADKGSVMNGREYLFADAFQLFMKKPLFGHGLGRGGTVLGYAWLENSYLLMLMESGIVGAVAFFLPYIILLTDTMRQIKRQPRKNVAVQFSFYTQLLFIMMSMVENYLASPLTTFLFFTIVFAGRQAAMEQEQEINTLHRGGL